jgi:threonine/homoserine/homoserine lactone efflux protein
MDIIQFAGEVIVLSTSGVLSPGPLFLANLVYGSNQGYYAGIKIANGHMTVELLLIILLSSSLFGFSFFTAGPAALRIVGMIGGIAIIVFAMAQILNIIKKAGYTADVMNKNNIQDIGYKSTYFFLLDKIGRKLNLGPLMVGMIFTAMNPFFVIWWLTVGIKLISDTIYLFGIVEGVFLLFLFHIWMDYAWLALTAYLISKGWSIVKMRSYHLFMVCINIVLISYGFYFLVTNII